MGCHFVSASMCEVVSGIINSVEHVSILEYRIGRRVKGDVVSEIMDRLNAFF